MRVPFEKRKVVVDENRVVHFYNSAYAHLAELLKPYSDPIKDDKLVILSVGSDGCVTRRLQEKSERVLTDLSKNEVIFEVFTTNEGTCTVRSVSEPYTWNKVLQNSVATEWSEGYPVVWSLYSSSMFRCSRTLSLTTNHDFDLYDLPDKYMAVAWIKENEIQNIESEDFDCRVMDRKIRKRSYMHDGERKKSTFDMVSLYPPTPKRPLQRPTDFGFDPKSDCVDTRTAKRFLNAVLSEYALPVDQNNTWKDPLGIGEWDATRGRLIWLLLSLDDDDLVYSCHTMSAEENDPNSVRVITSLFLFGPWFLSANFLDSKRKMCIPVGATSRANVVWDQSPGRWKSRLGMRSFHTPKNKNGIFGVNMREDIVHECSVDCFETLRSLVRHDHTDTNKCDSTVAFQEFLRWECGSCGDVTEESDRYETLIGAQVIRPNPTCKNGCDAVLNNPRKHYKAKCAIKNCWCKSREIACRCCKNESLARKQKEVVESTLYAVEDDMRSIATRVKNHKTVKVKFREKHEDESDESYAEARGECVDLIVDKYKNCDVSITVACQTDAQPNALAEEQTVSGEHETTLDSDKLVRDAYACLIPNATWNVRKCTRDAMILEFEGGSETKKQMCGYCMYGVCEYWKEDESFHCLACRRGMQKEDDSQGLLDVDVASFGHADSFSHDGKRIEFNTFNELVMKTMLKKYF